MRQIALGVAAAALFGCNAGNGGVYLFQMPIDIQPNCDIDIDHNFLDADVPEDIEFESDWRVEREAIYSDELFFAQIVKGKKGERFLIIQNNVYPGVKEDGGYTFEWTNSEVVDELYEYAPSPYAYSEVRDRTLVTRIRLDKASEFKGFDGTLTVEDVRTESYDESDNWDIDVPVGLGEISGPATQYLVDGPGEGDGRYNWPDEDNCSGNTCYIEVARSCTASGQFTARWTGYKEEGTYEYLDTVSQRGGY